MVKEIIVEEIRAGRRVIVPGFGAFISKDGAVVFVEFLKRDDGNLRQLIEQRLGLDTTDSSLAIENFVTSVKDAISSKGDYSLAPLGTMSMDDNGVYIFKKEVATPPKRDTAKTSTVEVTPAERPDVRLNITRHEPMARVQPQSSPRTVDKEMTSETTPTPKAEHSVDDLRYQRPASKASTGSYTQPKRIDSIMVVAIVVAIISIGVMIYGMLSDSAPQIELIENPVDTTQVK